MCAETPKPTRSVNTMPIRSGVIFAASFFFKTNLRLKKGSNSSNGP